MSSAILAPLPARLDACLGFVLVVCTISACSGDDPAGPETSTETPTPVLTSVSPDILIEGASFVIQGSNFSSSAGDNLVTVDGVGATVTAASATQLTATVPNFDCRPQRTADVQVSRKGRSSGPLATSVRPAAFVDAAAGELLLIDDPSDYCLQFPPAEAGSGEYLVGLGSAAERPETLFDVTMTGEEGETAPAPTPAAPGSGGAGGEIANPDVRHTAPARVAPTIRPRGRLGRPRGIVWRTHARAEHGIRRLERESLQRMRGARMPFASDAPAGRPFSAVGAPPTVGDEIQIKVPTWDATTTEGVCTPIQITTEVRVVGERGIFVTDIENPTTDALTDGEIQAFSDAFDSFIYDADVEYFGPPSDLDGNARIIVVLTVEVNKAVGGQIGGAMFALDLFEPSFCSASDYGELYYHAVPDPDNVAGTRPRSKADVTDYFLPVISHEFSHILQYSVRLRHGVSAPLALWEGEGQASLAIEIVGHAALGRRPGQDYDAAAALSVAGAPWYEGRFLALAWYYGHDLDGGRHADAPETCTLLFVDPLQDTGCEPGQGYGASWSFFRYLADRYGPGWSGGEAGLMRDWIDRNPTLRGAANVEALLGRPFDELFAEWAAMHYLDARVPDADPDLLMTSWNLGDVLPVLGGNTTLEPTTRTFADFGASLLVRGGSTAYSLFTDAAPRPATAIRFRDGSGGILGDDMRPVLWVVRTH